MITRFLFIALACTSCGTDWTSSTSPNSTGADAAPAPVTRCTSNTYWTFGTEGSSRMHPGDTCVGCHAQAGGEAPLLTAAGTVYPTLHEPTDCNGIAGGASVVISTAPAERASFWVWPKPSTTLGQT